MNPSNKIRVVVFDDNLFFRKGIHLLFEDKIDLELNGVFKNAKNIIRDVKKSSPDVVLMDIDMPDISGIEALKKIKKDFPSLPVIMLTDYDDEDKITDSFCADADGYILKTSPAECIINGIRDVHNGECTLCPQMAKRVMELFVKNSMSGKGNVDFGLTPREEAVLNELVKGHPYKVISHELGITYDTVRAHIKKIYAKLEVNTISGAVSKAVKNKMPS
ncbi:MAG TPA: response regulator transcription factor [Bacteroidia bacterium]|nr:response regulator transcription factor [Bacteroidia bacterium]